MRIGGKKLRKTRVQVRLLNIHLTLCFRTISKNYKAERITRQGSEKNHGKFGKVQVILCGCNLRGADKMCRAWITKSHWSAFVWGPRSH